LVSIAKNEPSSFVIFTRCLYLETSMTMTLRLRSGSALSALLCHSIFIVH